MFTDTGMPIEPFNIHTDIKEGLVNRDGTVKTDIGKEKRKRRGDGLGDSEDEGDSEDAWYDSVKEQ